MQYTYYLIQNGTTVQVEEPINWSDQPLILQRGNLHGIMYEYNPDKIDFAGNGGLLIQQAYNAFGSEAKVQLRIDALASGVLSTIYTGALVFKDYVRYSSAAGVYVSLTTENSTTATILNNKFDHKVNLDSLVSYDGITTLQPYNALGRVVTLPSKGIFIQDYSKLEQTAQDYVESYLGSQNAPYSNGYAQCTAQIGIGLPKQVAAELGNYGIYPNGVYTETQYDGATSFFQSDSFAKQFTSTNGGGQNVYPLFAPPVTDSAINYQTGTQNENGTITLNLDISASGKIDVLDCYLRGVIFVVCRLKAGLAGDNESHYDWLNVYTPFLTHNLLFVNNTDTIAPGGVMNFDFTYQDTITLNTGDQLFYFMYINTVKDATQTNNANDAYKITYFANGTYINQFKADTISYTPASQANLYMPNEILSRIVEGITNDKVRVKSNYFGRTDSLPYASATNGNGGIAGLAPGIFIRNQQNRITGSPFTFNLSLQQAINGLNPIHNIGIGLEPDTDRIGNYERLRIESWRFFYKNDILLELTDVAQIERRYIDNKAYGKITVGYNKYETEEYNGIDEFLTKREYRLEIDSSNNTLAIMSDLITSGFAIEITRRKQGIDTKDWRYDNDNFLIALKPSYNIPCSFVAGFFFITGAAASINIGDTLAISNSNWGGVDGTYTINSVAYQNGIYILALAGFSTFFFGTPNLSINGIPLQTYDVELGNINNPINIFEPTSIYNFRYSPARMLMHWLPTIMASYPNYNPNTSKVIFMAGERNYQAGGEQIELLDKLENQAIKENDTITGSLFLNPNNAAPFFTSEKIVLKYPLSLLQFMVIKNNPYGLIKFSNQYEAGEGWIDTIKYNTDNTMAEITLLPKR